MAMACAEVLTLHPGDVALGERGDRIETLLGSCVAIVLTDPRRTMAAACHIVHSRPATRGSRHTTAHADAALEAMVDLLLQRGISARLCEAYVYGGGNMFPRMADAGNVGGDNASWALAALREMGVRVVAQDLGGTVYRQLRWTVGPDAPHVVAVEV